MQRGRGHTQNLMTTSIASKPTAGVRTGWALVFDFLRNAAVLVGLWFGYALVRRVTADDWSTAIANAGQVVDFQNAIGLPSEARVQTFVIQSPVLVKAFNTFYMWGHFPLTGAFMAWVYFRRRPSFPVIRDALVVLTLAALVLHLVYPLAPPRILPGFIDTGLLFGPSPYDIGASSAANQLAAMPSMHVGWAMVVAISMIALNAGRKRFVFLIHPALTALVVVVTANHYWVDAIVAALLVVGAWEFSARLAHSRMLQTHHVSDEEPNSDEPERQLVSTP